MHRSGHLGFALLCWAPIALQLTEAGALSLALAGGVVCVSLTQLPDLDLSISLLRHRGPTHSISFALAVGAVCARAFGSLEDWLIETLRVEPASLDLAPAAPVAPLVPESPVAAVGGLAGVVAVGAHVVADSLTPAGVEPLWPINRDRYSLSLVDADADLVNHGVFYGGCVAATLAVLVGLGWLDPILGLVREALGAA